MDNRLIYIQTVTSNLLQVDLDIASSLLTDPLLQRFLSSHNLKSIVIQLSQEQPDTLLVGEAQFNRQVAFAQSVTFNKTTDLISHQNYKQEIIVSSGNSNNMLRNLQQMIESVFMQQKGLDYNIIQQLQALESNIDLSFKKNQEDEADLNNVMSIDDEQQYWTMKSTNDPSPRNKYFQDRFTTLFSLHLDLNNQDLLQLQNTIEQSFQFLNDIWNYKQQHQQQHQQQQQQPQMFRQQSQAVSNEQSYLAVRMKRMIRVLNDIVISRLRGEVDEKSIWNLKNNYRLTLQEVSRCLDLLEKTLQRQNWRTDPRWNVGLDEDYLSRLTQFRKTFDWIYQLRHQLELLNEFGINVHDIEKTLLQNRVGVNSTSKEITQMQQKVKEFYAQIKTNIAEKVRNKIFGQGNINRVSQDYKKYQTVIQIVKAEVEQERQELLRKLKERVEKIEEEFNRQNQLVGEEDDEQMEVGSSRNMSKNVMKMVWSRQLGNQVKMMSNQAKQIVNDLKDYSELEESIRRVLDNIEYYEQEQFDGWEQEVTNLLSSKDNPLRPEMNEQLLEMVDGELVVYFSERLVLLIRETRQMIDMEPAGRKVTRKIIEVVDNSKKYYKNAMKLKQIANFYNNMSEQIVESQQRMLVQEAMQFEDVINRWKIKSKRNIEEYVQQVCACYNQIINESSKLRRVHEKLIDQTVNLLEVDVVVNNKQYKQKLQQIRNLITITVSNRDSRLCRQWELHWQNQIGKVEQVQFRKGILSILDRIDRIPITLISHKTYIQTKPSIGQAKQQLYQQVSDYMCQFSMEMDSSDAEYIQIVYRQIEEMLEQVQNRINQYQQLYNVLQWLDPQEVVTSMLEAGLSVEEWKTQIQVIKTGRRQVQQLDEVTRVSSAVELNMGKYKDQVDQEIRDWLDQMTKALNYSIKQESQDVDTYVTEALAYYDTHKDLQGIDQLELFREVKSQNEQLQKRRESVQKTMDMSQQKHEILRYLGGVDANKDMKNVKSRWDNLNTVQTKYDQDLNDYQDNFKNTIVERGNKLEQQCAVFLQKWTLNRPKKNESLDKESVKEYSGKMKAWDQEWQGIKQKIEQMHKECQDLDLPPVVFAQQSQIDQELVQEQQMWADLDEFQSSLDELEDTKWVDLRLDLSKYQDFYCKYEEQMRLKMKEGHRDMVTVYIYERTEQLKALYSGLKLIVGEQFQQEHWRTLLIMLEIDKQQIEQVSFGEIVAKEGRVRQKLNEMKELAMRAQGEVSLREAVLELKIWLETAVFELNEHMPTDQKSMVIIKEWKDLLTKVGDQQALLASLRDSRYASRFLDQLEQFDKKLGPMDDLLRKMNQIQRKWVYLEPIFGRGALPSQQPRFQRLDTEYRQYMDNIRRDSRLSSLVTQPAIAKQLDDILEALEQCQKALNDFLEEKRNKFPRFYFLGDDDLLEILGQSKSVTIVQMHLKKLFTGIDKVTFLNEMASITHINSNIQEKVALREEVQVQGMEIEDWLQQLTIEMKKSLTTIQSECLQEKELQIQKYPSQVLQITENVRFCQQVVEAIKQQNLPNYKIDLQGQLENMTKLLGGSKGLIQNKLKALILDLIHNIDVVNQLLNKEVKTLDDWQWFKQLKYQQSSSSGLEVTMCKAKFNYSFEYQGNPSKLVHTPLTDKCYLTLTLGMHMGFGGCPYGPAGTGKTESVKALGQLLGRQVLVFNCDEGIDFKAMGRIFIGLVRTGSWGCFDEFNRLLEEQLSAISQQIQVIQIAIKERASHLQLLGKQINVDKEAAIFVTMNPAGKGYGGRSKLPDNLKQLFRPIAMTTPNNELIAEVLLFGEGFVSAQPLAKKIVSLFILSKQLLTKQQHYDWGLRALKTCLNVAGGLIQQERQANNKYDEAELLIKSIRINTLSKLTHSDNSRFKRLLDDIFPGVTKSDVKFIELEEAIDAVIKEMGYQSIDKQKEKILQFNEAIKQRTGAVLVGPSGCGKTTIWKILKKANERLKKQTMVQILNPKALPKSALLGYLNQDTREFTSGVLTAAARSAAREPTEVLCWVICDGDVDPEWIEALNSVLDDNRLLTLPTGERISFSNNVNFIFETNDLQYASPATISRMGMILLSDQDLPLPNIVAKWLSQQPEDSQQVLAPYVQNQLMALHNWITQTATDSVLPVQTTQLGRLQSVLVQLQGVTNKQQVMIGMLRGMAANLPVAYRPQLCQQLFKEFDTTIQIDIKQYPLEFELDSKNEFVLLKNQQSQTNTLGSVEEPQAINTVGLQRDLNMLQKCLNHLEPLIVVGPEGCGKSLLIRTAIVQLTKQQSKVNMATIHCNAQTTADNVIQKLQQVCVKGSCAQGNILKPKDCSRLIIYLKDINLPKPDKYQTIQLIAFLQQLITHKGYYDDNLEFVYLDEKIQIIASMAPSSTMGRHQLSTRFTANVRILAIDYPSLSELQIVYEKYMNVVFENKTLIHSQKVSNYLVEFYQEIKKNFTVDEFRHYQFTPRDLTRIVFKLKKHRQDFKDPRQFYEILYWESCRIFMDRITSTNSRSQFINVLQTLMQKHFSYDIRNQGEFVFTTLSSGKQIEKLNLKDFNQIFVKGYMQYEREVKEVNFRFLSEHKDIILAMDNSLNNNQSILIGGRSGMGRKTCVQLVSFLNGLEYYSLSVGRDYGIREFRKELKVFLEQVGGQNKQSVLFVEDYQLVTSEFLEQLNSLISAGEVPGLLTQEEIEGWLGPEAEELRRENWGKTLYESFCLRVKNNLRVILSLDYASPQFTTQCASNPSLYNCCNIIWSLDLNTTSMQQLCQIELEPDQDNIQNPSLSNSSSADYDKTVITSNASNMHKLAVDVLGNKVSPRQYYSLIHTYKKIYDSKVGTAGQQTKHLNIGLSKLKEAESQVDSLSKEAKQQGQELNIKQSEADQALKQITKAMENAAQRKQETQTMQGSLAQEEEKIQESKSRIEEQLSSILPQVEMAQKAVGSISKSNMSELKSFMMPVETVHDILSAVLKIFGNQDTSWNSMKKFIGTKGIIEAIINFDSRTLSKEQRHSLQAFLKTKAASFEKKQAYRASQAVGPMAEWVVAILKLSFVMEEIAPLEGQQKKIQNNLSASKQKCEENMRQLQMLDRQVEDLKNNFQKTTGEAATLKRELKNTEQTLHNANTLLDKLSGEKNRWMNQLKIFEQEKKMLPVNSLLAAAFTVYLSQEDEDMREQMMKSYKEQMQNKEFNYLRFMRSENQILRYKAEGLPGDNLSLENSAAIFQGFQTSMIIDPNYQATQWLITHLEGAEELIQFGNKYTNSLELGIRFGKTLIVKEVNCIDPLLVPILRKDLIRQGPRAVIVIGDKTVDYSPDFKLFVCTRNSSIELPSYHKGLVNIINFTVTRSGLENKLLSIVIDHEQPELELKKSKLVQEEENLKIQLADSEKQLLEKLAESKGNILENTQLIETLEQTKDKSIQIQKSLQESNKLQISLDEQRNVYRPLASQGAQLFLLLSDTKKLNNMYRFSQEQFVNIFKKSLEIEYTLEDSQKKMQFAQSNMYRNTVNSIGGALFKQDRLILGLHLLQGLRPNLFEKNEWEFFLGLTVGQSSNDKSPSWIPNDRQTSHSYLIGTFQTIKTIQWNELEQTLLGSQAPEKSFNSSIKQKLSEFQRLLIIQAIRPDRLSIGLQSFICDNLNLQSITGLPFSFDSIYRQQSNNRNPILFLVSTGSDPSKELEEYGQQTVGSDKISSLSMGGGQDEVALEMLRAAAQDGHWLIFKNLHLVTHWLPILEKELRILTPHEDFRFWLTTEPHIHFPSILLETCIKVSYEAPPGIKKNLVRLQQASSISSQPASPEQSEKATLSFTLNWLHALLQERRTYIPQGWSKFYEFSYSDLRSAQTLLEEQFRMNKTATRFQWQTITGLFLDAVYGGRIDNEFDLQVLSAYLQQLFNKDTVEGGIQITNQLSLPKINTQKDIQTFIHKLPDNDNPQLFGLPSNIDQAVQRYQVSLVTNGLKVLRQVSIHDMSFDSAKWTLSLTPLLQLYVQTEKTLQTAFPKTSEQDCEDSMLSFIQQEIADAGRAFAQVSQTMNGLKAVLNGKGLLTPKIFRQGSMIIKDQVPGEWTSFWEGPENPITWLLEFSKKAKSLPDWLNKTQNNTLLSQEISLSNIFYSEIFLNCLRQMTARKIQQSVDNLKLEASFDKNGLKSEMILKVQGLYLQGSGFRNGVICEPEEGQSEFIQIPVCYFAWTPISSLEIASTQQLAGFPIFHSGSRENILCKVNLPVQGKQQRILAGTALFLNNTE